MLFHLEETKRIKLCEGGSEAIAVNNNARTTKGISGMYLKADELSITIGPLSAVINGAFSSANSPETARNTKSQELRTFSIENSSTTISP